MRSACRLAPRTPRRCNRRMRCAHVLVFVRGAIAAALVSGGLAAQGPVPIYDYGSLLGRMVSADWLWSSATLAERCV